MQFEYSFQNEYIRPHKNNYLFSIPTRPEKIPRPPNIFYFSKNPSNLVYKLSKQHFNRNIKNGDLRFAIADKLCPAGPNLVPTDSVRSILVPIPQTHSRTQTPTCSTTSTPLAFSVQ